MSETLESYFEKSEARKLLVKNLAANLNVLADSVSKEDKETLMRLNLIMIRQCLQDHGVE